MGTMLEYIALVVGGPLFVLGAIWVTNLSKLADVSPFLAVPVLVVAVVMLAVGVPRLVVEQMEEKRELTALRGQWETMLICNDSKLMDTVKKAEQETELVPLEEHLHAFAVLPIASVGIELTMMAIGVLVSLIGVLLAVASGSTIGAIAMAGPLVASLIGIMAVVVLTKKT
jgi:hypothetical protein